MFRTVFIFSLMETTVFYMHVFRSVNNTLEVELCEMCIVYCELSLFLCIKFWVVFNGAHVCFYKSCYEKLVLFRLRYKLFLMHGAQMHSLKDRLFFVLF